MPGIFRINDNNSLYIKKGPFKKILLAEIFVDDTLFTGNDDLCKTISEEMSKEFEMSMFREIKILCWITYSIEERWYLHYSI